ncbi:MAG: UDP-N-acetylglucosamine--N-acetylmuramyl-(pentapeptide) pyrophosphoryl-undecaprenol N-acetylglucosamine transferase, partial [Gammaproteobacteria bacterium]|nr:UDP-N-acetylglucosamine--N-acetylmuramyl-(pentapeptide) pyrophosphoryl-undecaprenol N-acetylglucosamine transferase [Gammaproteobacteria bacterium]
LVVHEQNAIPGMTNRWLARVATRVLAAFPDSFPVTVGARVIGNPVRREITAIAEPRPIDPGRPLHLLVMGGSLGAQALNEGVPAALALLSADQRPRVRHQAGRGKAETTQDAYKACSVEATVSEFLDDMAEAYGWADLIVCRAGALTVSELMAAGKASVLVPFPFAVDDHQTANARFLTQSGAAQMMPQTELDPKSLSVLLRSLLSDRTRLDAMANNAYRLARRDATRSVADVCEELVA